MTSAARVTTASEIGAGLSFLAAVIAAEGEDVPMSKAAATELSAAVEAWRPSAAPDALVARPCPQPAARWHLDCLLLIATHDATKRARRMFHARLLGFLLAPDRQQFRPLVTVLIPVYNRAAMCAEAVESCLAQSWRPLEILVVDDGSTDDLASALRPFGDDVRLLRKANGGVSSARNVGIAAARGDFIHFLDSDNLLPPGAIMRKIEAFAAVADAELCWSSATVQHPSRTTSASYRRPTGSRQCPTTNFLAAVATRCPLFVSTVMMPRWVTWDAAKFEEDVSRNEDYRYWTTLAMRGTKTIAIASDLMIRRMRPNSLGGSSNPMREPQLVVRGRNLRDALADQATWLYVAKFWRLFLRHHAEVPMSAEPTATFERMIDELRATIADMGRGSRHDGLSALPILADLRGHHREHMRDGTVSNRRDSHTRLIANLGPVISDAIRRAPNLTDPDMEFWLKMGRPNQEAIYQFLSALKPRKRGLHRSCAVATSLLRQLNYVPAQGDVARYRRIRRWFGVAVARLALQVLPRAQNVRQDQERSASGPRGRRGRAQADGSR